MGYPYFDRKSVIWIYGIRTNSRNTALFSGIALSPEAAGEGLLWARFRFGLPLPYAVCRMRYS